MTVLQATEQPSNNALVLAQHADVVHRYFTLFNLGEYHQVARLFTPRGTLYPPFDSPVVGADSIENYLIKEAEGMEVFLLSAETHRLDDSHLQVDVRGKVSALVFQVNVAWRFILTEAGKIQSVRVDLMATLEELLKFRPL